MSEPYTIVLQQSALFDGTTPISGTIGGSNSDFTISNRTYTRTLDGGGLVPADFWGLFSADSPKVVGISARTRNPHDLARVVSGGAFDQFREQVDLRPIVQHVIMYPGDDLALLTVERGIPVELLVQPLSESDHVDWSKRYGMLGRTRRYRITRGDQSGWQPGANPPPLALTWGWNATTGINEATVTTQGVFPLSSFFESVVEGVEAWVRVSGAGAIILRVREGGPNGAVQDINTNLGEGNWSERIHLGFDDLIQIETGDPPAGKTVQVDIEFGPPRHRRCPCPDNAQG